MVKLSAVFLLLASLFALKKVEAEPNSVPSNGIDYRDVVKVVIKNMMDSSTPTPPLKPNDQNREHVSSPHSPNDTSHFEKTLKGLLMKLWHSTSTHNPKNVNCGDVVYYQGQDYKDDEMFMKMIQSNPNENKRVGQYTNYPGSHSDNHRQYGNHPKHYENNNGQHGNNPSHYGNNQGYYGNSPDQYGRNSDQFARNPNLYGNSNHGPYSNPGQYGNNPGLFNPNQGQFYNNPRLSNPNSSQFGNNQGTFNPTPGQYGNNPGLFNPNPGQYGNNPSLFNPQLFSPNPSLNGNNQGTFNPIPGQYDNNPSRFNDVPGPRNSQLQDIRTTTVAPSTTSPTLAALEDQRKRQNIQQGIAIPLGILTSLRQTLTGGTS